MNTKALIAIALAALLVFAGGAAALPGNAPDDAGADAADDRQPDDPATAADDADEDANETATNGTDADDARDENASEGPPTDMPEQVPDHVTTIHQLIRDKLNGDLGNTSLGEAISGVVGGDDEADEQAADASENADDRSGQARENGQSNAANAGLAGDLPEQAADHVGAIHDAIQSFLNGDRDGNPGDDVSTAASD